MLFTELQTRQSSKVSVQLIQNMSWFPLIASDCWKTRLTYGVISGVIGRKFDRREPSSTHYVIIPSTIIANCIHGLKSIRSVLRPGYCRFDVLKSRACICQGQGLNVNSAHAAVFASTGSVTFDHGVKCDGLGYGKTQGYQISSHDIPGLRLLPFPSFNLSA